MSKLTEVEGIKARSRFLRGTIVEGLADDLTGSLPADDTQLTKFHGFYQQDDRDLRAERKQRKLEPLYSFMLRARVPGGVITPAQWLAIDTIARDHTTAHSLRLTTRQTFQYHGITKGNLKPLIQGMNQVMIDAIAACGDVNRNVLCSPNPVESRVHLEVYEWAKAISEHLLPATRAYHEIWLDGEKVASEDEQEPIYGPTYLPRKFKTAVVVPPVNDVDVRAHDLGFIAIVDDGRLLGFNVTVGGGMGMTHGDKETFPRLADDLGFISPEDTLKVAEAVVTTQRDWGNRSNRKRARLKYTIEDHGLDNFRDEVARRAGVSFDSPRPVYFDHHGDRIGWHQGFDKRWHLTLFVPSGRLVGELLTGVREIAKVHKGDFRMTANQNLIVAGVHSRSKKKIETLARDHGLLDDTLSPLHEQAMACVALPTCTLAMAEAERYLPTLIERVEALLEKHQVIDVPLSMRMTGCPNGCARPYLAEIGLVGKGPGHYNLYLGGDGRGERLNKLYRENIDEATILATLDPLLGQYAQARDPNERFGDFVVRTGIVAAVNVAARDFHD